MGHKASVKKDTALEMSVPYVNLAAQFAEERVLLMPLLEEVLAKGEYIGGSYVEDFEHQLALYVGVKHAIALNSGTDALVLGLMALGINPGDEVITPPNSFIASTAAICHVGAKPVFADILPDQNIDPRAIEKVITKHTKAIMPVHLTGRMARMEDITKIAHDHGLAIIEDAAQGIGSLYQGKMAGSWGEVGCFSTHPLKNLNSLGDGGILTTNRDDVADHVRLSRNHGLKDRNTALRWGYVSRMDALQAAVLSFRLRKLPSIIEKRRRNAAQYRTLLDSRYIFMPPCQEVEFNTFHTFVIQGDDRDLLQAYLQKQGIGTAIHYPSPIHLQPAALSLGYKKGDLPITESQALRILSLPIHQYLTPQDIDFIAKKVNEFYKGKS